MVFTSAPSQATAYVMQEREGAPSISRVQAPQTPCSQEVGEVGARLHRGFDFVAIYDEGDVALHDDTFAIARCRATAWSWRA